MRKFQEDLKNKLSWEMLEYKILWDMTTVEVSDFTQLYSVKTDIFLSVNFSTTTTNIQYTYYFKNI